MSDLEGRARAWIADDPDPRDRAELEQLLAAGGRAAEAELADRFAGRLTFGTAGLRGAVGAGPNRMNRAVVRVTTVALAGWLQVHRPGSADAGVVVGCDARHRSADFADEVAAVLAGAGIRVHLLAYEQPTPLLAFAVPHLGAAAGVMITASHNPPADNGYKLYLGDGAQIVPPVDREIEAAIENVGPLSAIPVGDLAGPLVVRHDDEAVAEAYLTAVVAVASAPPGAEDLRVVYTPMHGVGRRLFDAALERAGFPAAHVVPEQADPDPDFPTVAFPNPEEPGALDLAFAEGRRAGADLVVANDPDADRLAVAIPDPESATGWRRLTGDEVGVLLGADTLERTAGEPEPHLRLVATSIVSSSMLPTIAVARGVLHEETLTGFKWIVRATGGHPGSRFVFGYEEALGYCVGEVVRDKDGIGAALAFLRLAAEVKAAGASIAERLDALARLHGVHLTAHLSLRLPSPEAAMERLRADRPRQLGSVPVEEVLDLGSGAAWQPGLRPLPPADVLVYRLKGARVIVRPSGTEPILKAYFEVMRPVAGGADGGGLVSTREAAGAELERLRAAVVAAVSE